MSDLHAAAARLDDPDLAFTERVEADLAFHLLLCRLSGNPMLVESWQHLEGRIRVAIMSHDADEAAVVLTVERHMDVAARFYAGG